MTKTTNKGFAVRLIDDEVPLSKRLKLIEKPIPQPKPGQVLVEVLATPVNPSDLVFLQGNYGLEPKEDLIAGFEACGIVRKSNAGLYGKWLEGKRVAFGSQPGYDGLWSQFAVTKASSCLPLRKELTHEQGATLIVNPLTSICLVDRARQLKSPAVIINAAASQVGKGIIRYAKQHKIKVIATVRSQSNVEVLQRLGADLVLLNTTADYRETLKQAAKQFNARVLIDAVAAEETAVVMRLMPSGSTAIIYGRLDETHSKYGGEYGVADLIFRDCRIEGFWLATFMRKASPWQILSISRKVQRLFAQGIFDTDIYAKVGFDDFIPALEHYAEHKSDGKVILLPQ